MKWFIWPTKYTNFKISKSIFIFMVHEISSKYLPVGYDDLLNF